MGVSERRAAAASRAHGCAGPGRAPWPCRAVPSPAVPPDNSPGWMSSRPAGYEHGLTAQPQQPARQPQPTCRLRQQKVFPSNLPATPKKIQEKTCKNVVLGSSMALSRSRARSRSLRLSPSPRRGRGPSACVSDVCCGVPLTPPRIHLRQSCVEVKKFCESRFVCGRRGAHWTTFTR